MPPPDDAAVIGLGPTGGALVEHRATAAALALALAALAAASASSTAGAALAAFVAGVLVLAAVSDMERRIIPNRLVLPSVAVVLATQLAMSPAHAPKFVLAALAAGFALVLPSLFNRAAMGMGDAKLALLLGAALGARVIPALILAFVAVFPVALATVFRGGLAARKSTLPFGPFLAFGGLMILIVPGLVGAAGG